MQVHEIKRVHPLKKSKTVARGGKRGKTAGRGGKGQTARAGHSVRPAMRDIIKKLPKLRGHGKNRAKSVFVRKPEAVVNVSALNVFSNGEMVNPTSLVAKSLIPVIFGKNPRIKILGTGELTVKIMVEGCKVSDTAKEKIVALGGEVKTIVTTNANTDAQIKKQTEKNSKVKVKKVVQKKKK